MIVITGATGALGSSIVARLLERIPAKAVAVSVRDIEEAAALEAQGVRVRVGDFTEPSSLAHAFEGAKKVLVVSASLRGPSAATANKAAIDAAKNAGAERILYTSHQAASKDSLFVPQTIHAETEQHLARQGVAFTALRNGFYASTLGLYVGEALETGRLLAPQDGPVSWTAHADLAEVAALAVLEDGALEGVTPPLTAPEMLDLDDVAGILGEITCRTISRVIVEDEEWQATAIERGMSAQAADLMLGMFLASRRGEFAVTNPTLPTLLGRRATCARTVLAASVLGH